MTTQGKTFRILQWNTDLLLARLKECVWLQTKIVVESNTKYIHKNDLIRLKNTNIGRFTGGNAFYTRIPNFW